MLSFKTLELANYTLTFGEEWVLLDLFDEVVKPSFQPRAYRRKIQDKGEFFFWDTKLTVLEEDPNCPILGIRGRLIKRTTLRRDQIFRDHGGIVRDLDELETAPSSLFLLILNNHRLIFCREVAGAPTIENFLHTSRSFLKRRHREWIAELHLENKKKREGDAATPRVTKKALISKYPTPNLRITPLSDEQGLSRFMNRFSHIDELFIRLAPTNQELNNDDFWRDFEERRKKMSSKSVTVHFHNFQDGLNRRSARAQCRSAIAMGNSNLIIRGRDRRGGALRGSNEDFKFSVKVEKLPEDLPGAARRSYEKFKELVAERVVHVPKATSEVAQRIRSLYDSMRR